jgi:hypothetical protein
MHRRIPWRELCANDCGRRRAKGEQLCSSCKRQREQMLSSPYPMEQEQRSGERHGAQGEPATTVALDVHETPPPEPSPEERDAMFSEWEIGQEWITEPREEAL